MNFEQTIAELDQQAQRYTDAANTLRALQGNDATTGRTATLGSSSVTKPSHNASSKSASSKARKQGQKRVVSPETRAKITAALKASHAAKRAAADPHAVA